MSNHYSDMYESTDERRIRLEKDAQIRQQRPIETVGDLKNYLKYTDWNTPIKDLLDKLK